MKRRIIYLGRPWGIHKLADMIGHKGCSAHIGCGVYVRSVPEPFSGNRLTAAWWVLTGRAYAVIWPRDGELEAALDDEYHDG
jgi:hypothetical protein